jgi:bifunctional NMN adenylyltransferase/nudix hydrolase
MSHSGLTKSYNILGGKAVLDETGSGSQSAAPTALQSSSPTPVPHFFTISQEDKDKASQQERRMPRMPYSLAVVIGRFQGFHSGHQILLAKAFSIADRVLVLVGSSHSPRTIKNPFTFSEREQFIQASVTLGQMERLVIKPLADSLYSDTAWAKSVQGMVSEALGTTPTHYENPQGKNVALVGHKKDESSYYLDMFPQYDSVNVDEVKLDFDATTIRTMMFEQPANLFLLESLMPTSFYGFITKFVKTDQYIRLFKEYDMIQKYKASWAQAPYAPTFLTADAVVVKNGHILMVRRKHAPGQGLLALPGGFINQNERIKDAALRELIEETAIDLPRGLLRNSIKGEGRVFDHPGRSLRGRTVTTAFLFNLDEADSLPRLPRVKGSDDAMEALWIPISEILGKREQIFEDHASIIANVLGLQE